MSASRAHVSVQDMSNFYTNGYCIYIISSILVYDWLLCLSQEVRFIWSWHSRGTLSSLLYALGRYSLLIQAFLAIATTYPMSDQSCAINAWVQAGSLILGVFAFSAFSALRAYALSNRNVWLAVTIVILALPPSALFIVQCFYKAPGNLPGPMHCTSSGSLLSQTRSLSATAITRGSQVVAETLVIVITWWYSYQSYRIRRGLKMGKTISSLLYYNGSFYFLFLATLYILDIVLAVLSERVPTLKAVDSFLTRFYDPITSILISHFIISLRKFNSTLASVTISVSRSRVREHVASTVLEFAAQPSDSLPSFIAPFAHPVHTGSALSSMESDEIVYDGSERSEIDAEASTLSTVSGQSPGLAPDQGWASDALEYFA